MDQERFTMRWTRSQPVVANFISSMVPDFNQAEDILQEVAVVLLRRFDEYDDRQSFTGWALGIARNKILASCRRSGREVLLGADIVDTLAQAHEELAPELDRRTAALRLCLKEIRGHVRELLRLRYEDRMNPQEIAKRHGMSSGAVRVALTRVRGVLRDCIQRRGSSEGWLPDGT